MATVLLGDVIGPAMDHHSKTPVKACNFLSKNYIKTPNVNLLLEQDDKSRGSPPNT